MKNKMILLIALPFLLTSCSIFNKRPSSSSDFANSLTSSSTKNNKITSISQYIETSIANPSIYEDEYYKNIKLAAPENLVEHIVSSKDELTYEDLFNLNNKVSISIDMEESELEKLNNDFAKDRKTEKYRHAKKVTITLVNGGSSYVFEFDDVGIRQKGNTSRGKILSENGELNLFHIKLSFDETWTDASVYDLNELTTWNDQNKLNERKNRNLLGLSGLDTKWNKTCDLSHIREIYASMLYKACGVISQNISLSEMQINRVNKKETIKMGLYNIYEPASKTLIKRALKKGNIVNMTSWNEEKNGEYGIPSQSYGDLYKASYGKGEGTSSDGASMTKSSISGKSVGVNNASGTYIPSYNRKTNKDIDDDNIRLKNFINAVNDKDYEELNNYMDMAYFGIVEACNYIIGNADDMRNNANNYMIYLRKKDGKAIIIPLDNDRAFGAGGFEWNPDGNSMSECNFYETKTGASKYDKDISNPLYKKTILSSSKNEAKAYYFHYANAIKDSEYAKTTYFKQAFDLVKTSYSSSSSYKDNSSSFDIKGSLDSKYNMSFEEYMKKKMKMIPSPFKNVYLVGTINEWKTSKKDYPLTYKGNGIYEITLIPKNNELTFKFCGEDGWDNLNWGKGANAYDLSLNSGGDFIIKDLDKNKELKIIVNLNTLKISYQQI